MLNSAPYQVQCWQTVRCFKVHFVVKRQTACGKQKIQKMNKISTKNLANLPDIKTLQRLCKSLATLDAVICQEWEHRYYSYDCAWGKYKQEEYFSMRDGSGDEFQVLFSRYGSIINGIAHESEMSKWIEKEIKPVAFREKLSKLFGQKKTIIEQKIWKGVVDTIPGEFKEFIFGEPIKSKGTTFCIWRKINDDSWKIGDIQFPKDKYGDGSANLLYIFDNNPATYKKWATEYYEEQFDVHKLKLDLVKHIYDFKPLTKDIALGLNPQIDDFEGLKTDLNSIGYPHEGL
jgi:hypothetical protein